MAKRGKTAEAAARRQERWSFGTLIGGVALVLVLGAFLQSDANEAPETGFRNPRLTEIAQPEPEPRFPDSARPDSADDHPIGEESRLPAPSIAVAHTSIEALVDRAGSDLRRIEDDAAGWTLQYLVACDPANVRPLVASLGDDSRFWLLPQWIEEQACFRVCWGRYPSREAAVGAADVPSMLSQMESRPVPRRIGELHW